MKTFVHAVLAVLIMTGAAVADQFNAMKKAGDLTVRVVGERSLLQVGDNPIEIEILDGRGDSISDAAVSVYYFMPSMPAMNYEVLASYNGKKYAAVIKPVMPGAWDADIKVSRKGSDSHKATISFTVQ